jgi:hypothetical protein
MTLSVSDAAADRSGEHEEDRSHGQHQAGPAVRESCEAIHHPRRSLSASRSHQAAIHSLSSMP